MLLPHLTTLEDALLGLPASAAQGDPPADATQEGGPWRAAFVQGFVDPLFGGELRIDRGGVFDSRGGPGDTRPVFDVLLCQRHAPRLLRADGAVDVPVELVVAAIRVLPRLDEATMTAAALAARSVKALRRDALRMAGAGALLADEVEPAPAASLAAALQAVPCYLVAFDGPPQMAEAHTWLRRAYRDNGIVEPDMEPFGSARALVPSPALDGVFVLGRGFLNFDNLPFGFFNDATRLATIDICWAIADAERGSLASLYLQLNLAATAMAGTRLDPRPYMAAMRATALRFGN